MNVILNELENRLNWNEPETRRKASKTQDRGCLAESTGYGSTGLD
jgi:hypothetical protein